MEDKIIDIAIILGCIAIIVLKIVGIITIPWLWLLFPIWGLFAIGIIMAIIFFIMILINKGERKK